MPKVRSVIIVVCALALFGTGAGAEEQLRASSSSAAPELDGVVDPVWEEAGMLTVTVHPVSTDLGEQYKKFDATRGTAARDVSLKALVNGGRIYVLAQWPDETHSVVKKPWVWDEGTKAYKKGPGDEDRFSLLLPMGKEATDCMVGGVSFVGDLWHWKAARTEPAGYADDQTLRMGIKNFRGAEEWYGPGGRTVYGKRYNDEGVSAYSELKEPPAEFAGETVARYAPRTPEGSRGDIRTGAAWKDGVWTLEMSRDLDTGDQRADRALTPGTNIGASVAIFDDCGDLYHATSPLFSLIVE